MLAVSRLTASRPSPGRSFQDWPKSMVPRRRRILILRVPICVSLRWAKTKMKTTIRVHTKKKGCANSVRSRAWKVKMMMLRKIPISNMGGRKRLKLVMKTNQETLEPAAPQCLFEPPTRNWPINFGNSQSIAHEV